MNDRTVIVHDQPVVRETLVDNGDNSTALVFGAIAVIAILLIGLFVWQPWNTTTTSNTRVTTSSGDTAGAAGGGSSTTTTTTTGGSSNTGGSTNP